MLKVVTILGARPQFIKAAVVSRTIELHKNIKEIIIHTGQHFDANMSEIFFEQMSIPKPNYGLELSGLSHGAMTGRMLEEIESILQIEKPDYVLVYGDTNSTLAGALAAVKLHIPVVHVEAGLRSFNLSMPEEVNRILADRISTLLLCPTDGAVENLLNEGYQNMHVQIENTGDVMQDAALFYRDKAILPVCCSKFANLNDFVLCTIHRAENTNDIDKLKSIVGAINEINTYQNVVLPLHPRTKKILEHNKIKINALIIDPVGYLEMIYLLDHCELVITDSGGLQKEAFFFQKPCVTLREETEWLELVEYGYNKLAGSDKKTIINSWQMMKNKNIPDNKLLYGGGNAAATVVDALIKHYEHTKATIN